MTNKISLEEMKAAMVASGIAPSVVAGYNPMTLDEVEAVTLEMVRTGRTPEQIDARSWDAADHYFWQAQRNLLRSGRLYYDEAGELSAR